MLFGLVALAPLGGAVLGAFAFDLSRAFERDDPVPASRLARYIAQSALFTSSSMRVEAHRRTQGATDGTFRHSSLREN